MNERVVTKRTLAVGALGGELIGVRSRSGRPLLVLHGGPAVNDYSDWFAAELAGWDALRYTQRGIAPSVTEGPFTIEQHVSDALAVLDNTTWPPRRFSATAGAGSAPVEHGPAGPAPRATRNSLGPGVD